MGDLFEKYAKQYEEEKKRGRALVATPGEIRWDSKHSASEKYRHYSDIVKRPGKFEGEKPYVPYFYEIYLEGFASEEDGGLLRFTVSAQDKEIFPELKRRKVVRLTSGDAGFVVESYTWPKYHSASHQYLLSKAQERPELRSELFRSDGEVFGSE